MKDADLIYTAKELFNRHISDISITKGKALYLAKNRQRQNAFTTVFEDPVRFYRYNRLGVIISEKPVKCFEIQPGKETNDLKAVYRHHRWAIFEGPNFHYNWRKNISVPAVF